jgi:hypothetical protein
MNRTVEMPMGFSSVKGQNVTKIYRNGILLFKEYRTSIGDRISVFTHSRLSFCDFGMELHNIPRSYAASILKKDR